MWLTFATIVLYNRKDNIRVVRNEIMQFLTYTKNRSCENMPDIKGKRLGVMVYFKPETYRALEDSRNPHISSSAYCAMIIDEVINGNKRQED
jgi:hypothetical protein